MSDNNKLATGIFILAAGIFILLGKWGVFSFLFQTLWPLILLIPGILLHFWVFFRRGSTELLLPAGILIVYALLCFIGIIWGWTFLFIHMWPAFILGIAVGLLEYVWFTPPRQQGLFILALLLVAVSFILLTVTWFSFSIVYILAAVLIGLGLWLILSRERRGQRW